jgi:hypothetical protein
MLLGAANVADGQKRRFDRLPFTSGLSPSTDIVGVRRHVANVPILLQKSARRRRGTVGAFLKPPIVTRWILRATYARLY